MKGLDVTSISTCRQIVLKPLIDYIQEKVDHSKPVNLNFICTHNSRRSHLSQIWAQTAAEFYKIPGVHCYSGGTEVTAVFPMVISTLQDEEFEILKIAEGSNPVYAVKSHQNAVPVIAFSKTYDDPFNPKSDFAAIMTCSSADEGCPFIPGAEARIPVTYDDPKLFDGTDLQKEKYLERSREIASEMVYVFSSIKYSDDKE